MQSTTHRSPHGRRRPRAPCRAAGRARAKAAFPRRRRQRARPIARALARPRPARCALLARPTRPACVALAERAQVLEAVNSARVAVEPLERERVAAHHFDVVELLLRVTRLEKTNLARMPLTTRARAIAPQDGVRVEAPMSIGP